MVVTFSHPYLLNGLWLLLLLPLLRWRASAAGARAVGALVAGRLQGELVAKPSAARSGALFWLQWLSLTGLLLAVAGPRWGEEKVEVTEKGRNVLIAIDTSRSMNTPDVRPNRLERAKLAAEDLMVPLAGERVGLIAVAGRGYLQAPFTADHEAVVESIQALDSYTIPVGGSQLSSGIKEALQACEKTGGRNHCMIFFSDGGEEDAELKEVLNKAKEKNLRILAIGVGTEAGDLIPDVDKGRRSQFVLDPATQRPVHSRLNPAVLKQMAVATGGQYMKLSEQAITAGFVADVLGALQSMETGNKEQTKPVERFYWPLLVAILCLMCALLLRPSLPQRRSAVALFFMMLVLGAAPTASAVEYSPEAAQKAYDLHDYAYARDIYSYLLEHSGRQADRLYYGLGAASHKLREYPRAAEAFSKALESADPQIQRRAHHGLGNTLYELGDKSLQSDPDFTLKAWMDALDHYAAALAIQDDKGVRENRDELLRRIQVVEQQQQQTQQQQKKDQNQKEQKGEQQEQQDGEGQPQDGNPKQEEKGDKPDSKGKQGKEDKPQDGKQAEGEQGKEEKGGETPEGKIEAAEAGDKPGDKKAKEMVMAEEVRDDKTGFSKNEARALLRTYNEVVQDALKKAQERLRAREPGRDW